MKKEKAQKSKFLWAAIILVIIVVFLYFRWNDLNSELIAYDSTVSVTELVYESASPSPITSTDAQSTGVWYEIYFTEPQIPFEDNFQGGIENQLIKKIDNSTKSIDVAVFEFDIETVALALIRAHERGVVIRVVYDNEHTEGDPQMSELKKAGIIIVPDDRSAFMHNKFFVFDNECIWTGSFNISMNAAYRNNENAIYFCSTEAALNYVTEFEEMFLGEFGSTSPSNTPYPSFIVNGIKIENFFAPEDDVMKKVIQTINTSKTSIHFMAYSFTDDNLGKAMIERGNDGVIVEGIFETLGANTEYSECETLLIKGFNIRIDGNPRTFHHKVIIIDSSTVILGSFNFSANADTRNDENLLIIYDSRLAKDFEEQYQLMKSQSVTPSGNSCSK